MEEALKYSFQIRPSFLVFKVLLLQKVLHYFIIGIFCLPDYSMLILSLNSGNFLSVWLFNKLTHKTNNPKAHLLQDWFAQMKFKSTHLRTLLL